MRKLAFVFSVALLTGALIFGCSESDTGDLAGPESEISLQAVGGLNQSGPPGAWLTDPLVAEVTRPKGKRVVPVSGQVVNFRVVEGGGEVFAGVSITDAAGIAQELWKLGDQGPQRVEARAVDSGTGEPLTFAVFTATVEVPQYTVGGEVTGLTQLGLVLQNNGGDDLTITAPASFTFATPLDDGSSYNVTIYGQPQGELCALTNGSGTIAGANVTNVVVLCGSALDADQDGYDWTVDCDDGASSCTSDCVVDTDEDGVADCLDLCLDWDGDDFGIFNETNTVGGGSIAVGDCTTDGTTPCTFPGQSCDGSDCDDGNPSINPTAQEECDGVDNNCNGQIDDGELCSAPNATCVCTGASGCAIGSCDTGWDDCNSLYGDGCEIDLLSDELNCGACGAACPAGWSCNSGSCAPPCAPNSCYIDGVCYSTGATSPSFECMKCDPSVSITDWTAKTDGTPCSGGNCQAGVCVGGGGGC